MILGLGDIFSKWRAFSHRLARAFLAGFGAICALAALESGYPTWARVVFGLAGVFLLLGAWHTRR